MLSVSVFAICILFRSVTTRFSMRYKRLQLQWITVNLSTFYTWLKRPLGNLKHGLGLITLGDWAHGLQSTRRYFEYVNNKDWQRLLLQPNPIANDEWDFEEEEAPTATDRYFKCLVIFIRVLEEEETRMTGSSQRELTELVKWSRDIGAMWLHMLLSTGFFDDLTFPYMQLRNHKGVQW